MISLFVVFGETLTLKGDYVFFNFLDHANTYERYPFFSKIHISILRAFVPALARYDCNNLLMI